MHRHLREARVFQRRTLRWSWLIVIVKLMWHLSIGFTHCWILGLLLRDQATASIGHSSTRLQCRSDDQHLLHLITYCHMVNCRGQLFCRTVLIYKPHIYRCRACDSQWVWEWCSHCKTNYSTLSGVLLYSQLKEELPCDIILTLAIVMKSFLDLFNWSFQSFF